MINVFANIFKVPVMRQSAIKMSLRLASTEATFQTKPFKLHKLDSGPDIDVHVTKEDAVRYYTQMQTIRRMESASGNLYKEKKVRGFCHLYSGQEACAVGTKAAMDAGDAAITSYRCHGWMYLSGSSVAKLLCELTGRVTGTVCGKGGSMHVYGEKFYGGNGIVGAQQPLGTGIAFAMKYRKEKNVCITVFGDGAANQGQLFESMNMAKLWDLPVVYVCENNGYGMGTAAARAAANTDYYTRGDYVPGIWVDGMDVLAVRQAIRWAKEWCNAGKGPLMIEMATYRYGGHSMSDPGTSYRTREEIQEVRKTRDPIVGFKDKIVTAGLVTEDDLKEIDKQVRMEIDDAVKQAHTDKEPPMDLLLTDIYYNTPAQYVRCTTNEVLQKYLTSEEAVKALAK